MIHDTNSSYIFWWRSHDNDYFFQQCRGLFNEGLKERRDPDDEDVSLTLTARNVPSTGPQYPHNQFQSDPS